MSFVFDIHKNVQIAAFFLTKEQTARMPYMKLLKLMYIADRTAIEERALPMTGDDAYAMKLGPVLSNVYDVIHPRKTPFQEEWQVVWDKFFKTEDFDICLLQSAAQDELSAYELSVLHKIYEKYKDHDEWGISDFTHNFQEWQKNWVEGKTQRISLYDQVEGVGRKNDFEAIQKRKQLEVEELKLFGLSGS